VSSPEHSSQSFADIVEANFWQNPTDGAFTEAYWQELHAQFMDAIDAKDPSMWDIADKMRIVGKFFPIDDDRNPDNPKYQRSGQQG
jgi:hypothetical protein